MGGVRLKIQNHSSQMLGSVNFPVKHTTSELSSGPVKRAIWGAT